MAEVGFAGGSDRGSKRKKKGRAQSRKRSARLKIYSQQILKGKSKKDAALMAGYALSTAENAAQKIEKPNQDYFRQLMDRFVPDELMALKVREGLDATVVKTATADGEITDMQEFADFGTRAKYLELAAEFKGKIKRGGDVNVAIPIMLHHSVPRPQRDPGNVQ